jgi:hypothetical protein
MLHDQPRGDEILRALRSSGHEPANAVGCRIGAFHRAVLRSFGSGPVADRWVAAAGEWIEEGRLVAALFADLSGFTGWGEIDPNSCST